MKLVRRLDERWAAMHAHASTILPGEIVASRSRSSMQLFVARRHGDGWLMEAMRNSRVITLDDQEFLDDLCAAPLPARDAVVNLAAAFAAAAGGS